MSETLEKPKASRTKAPQAEPEPIVDPTVPAISPAAPMPLRELVRLERPLTKPELRSIGEATPMQSGEGIVRFFDEHKPSLAKVAPQGMHLDRLLGMALSVVRSNPKLQQCSIASLFGAVVRCAQMGLEPNAHSGHVFLVPRAKRAPVRGADGKILEDSRGKQVWEATWEVEVQIGYKGRIELAYRQPLIRLLKAVLVHENDVFELEEGTTQRITHKPLLRGDRGPIIGVYALCQLATGADLFRWMNRQDVERVRDTFSDAFARAMDQLREAEQNNDEKAMRKARETPWIRNEEAMFRKTAINAIDPFLPSTPAMAIAASLEDRSLRGFSQELAGVLREEAPAAMPAEPGKKPRRVRGKRQPDGVAQLELGGPMLALDGGSMKAPSGVSA